jgi:ParB family chromosome partitioning protein
MKSQRVLGKGLSALIPGAENMGRLGDKDVRMIPLSALCANPRQPRKSFNDNTLQELAESITRVGVLQPILVRKLRAQERQAAPGPAPETSEAAASARAVYCLVAGERRVRAARMAGVRDIPAIVCSYEETEALKVALLENIQREDLGPLEEAAAYRELLESYGATQEELADMLGKNRSSVANTLRLLTLEPEIQAWLAQGEITRGHAKVLLGLPEKTERLRLARLCRSRGLSVRECERRVQILLQGRRSRRRRASARAESPEIRELRERTERLLGFPVRIERNPVTGKGQIAVRFFSDQDLMHVLEKMGVDPRLS